MSTSHMATEWDAILIPGGGVESDGSLPVWVKRRLDRAIELHRNQFLITLSAGTTHKPSPLDTGGRPIFESVAGARYLIQKGISADRILVEASSYDTIGNAYFSRVIHVDPAQLRRLLVITSEFHMPRTRRIFEWVYGLDGTPDRYALDFESVSDSGIEAASLRRRTEKERVGLELLNKTIPQIHSLQQLHRWLFASHDAYRAASAQNPAVILAEKPPLY